MFSTVSEDIELLAVPTNGALLRLMNGIDNASLPVIDIEVIVALAIDALIYKHGIIEETQLLIKNIRELDESICHCLNSDRDDIPSYVIDDIANAVNALIQNVCHCVCDNNMYTGDFFNFEFARIADNDNLLLRRVGGR